MKILRIIYDWPPPWQGLAPHPYEITTTQAKMGHDVEIFCGRWPKAGEIEQPDGVKVNPIVREPLNGTIFFTSSVILFFKYLSWRRKNNPDIIHSHGHFGIWIYFYRKFLQRYFPWSKELKVPLVVHFHNIAKDRWDSMEKAKKEIKPISKFLVWPLSVFSDKQAVKTASACIFVSQDNMKKAIDLYGADPKRCFVVESGVNSSLFKPVSPEEREKSKKDVGFDPDDKIILNHGLMSERKNIHLLIESFKYLPRNYKLFLVGSGDYGYTSRLNTLIKENNLTDRVVKVGYTPYPLTPIAYQISDIFILPSSWEGMPKVVMQGLACGVPCLVSGFKLSEEIRGLYYLESLNPQHIANFIIQLVENPVSVDVQKIALYYSWEARVKEINNVYEFAKKNYLV